MTRGENFMKKEKCENIQCSAMSRSAWCVLNSEGKIFELHNKCLNPKCNCQKVITITPHQYMLKLDHLKVKFKKFSAEHKLLETNFLSQLSMSQHHSLLWIKVLEPKIQKLDKPLQMF